MLSHVNLQAKVPPWAERRSFWDTQPGSYKYLQGFGQWISNRKFLISYMRFMSLEDIQSKKWRSLPKRTPFKLPLVYKVFPSRFFLRDVLVVFLVELHIKTIAPTHTHGNCLAQKITEASFVKVVVIWYIILPLWKKRKRWSSNAQTFQGVPQVTALMEQWQW